MNLKNHVFDRTKSIVTKTIHLLFNVRNHLWNHEMY
jgi:hypothetical protein